MTSRYETELNLENTPTRHSQQARASSEAAYDRLSGYGFARRYVKGKLVADIGWEEIGYGPRLLAEIAESVEGLTNSPEAVGLASTAYPVPNVSYRSVDLSELPYSESYFDAVVAFGVVEHLEHPADLVGEIKRVLKKDGVLVISALDKLAYCNDGSRGGFDNQRREMYVPELRELLEHHFGHVHVYRQGAVAGGFVFPVSGEVTGAQVQVESARFSLTNPDLGAEPPTTRSVIAVCSDTEVLGQEEQQPYLLLDRDRGVFDECEEHAEDVALMRGEIQQMQETEVQAFLDALRVQQSLYYVLKRYPIHLRNIIHTIRTESRMYRRLATPYRWLRTRNSNSD
jgi:SAM-dependent methyltransferase